MQSRQLVWAEHVVHAGCDGSLGNLTGCIEVLAATCAAAAAAAVAAAAATLSMTFVASMHGGSGAPRNQCVCGWCGQGMRSMQDATARLGTWLDASKCCYFPLCYCCCHAERDACCIFEGEGAVARARHISGSWCGWSMWNMQDATARSGTRSVALDCCYSPTVTCAAAGCIINSCNTHARDGLVQSRECCPSSWGGHDVCTVRRHAQ